MTTTDQWQKPGEPALYPRGRLMNRGVRRVMTSAIALLGVAWQLACSDSSQVPEVLVSASLPMARAGASVRIDFTVTQAHLAARRRLMVALDFPQTRDGKLEDLILQQDLPVALNVALVQDGQLTPVPTQDNRAIIEPSRGHADGDVVNLHCTATTAAHRPACLQASIRRNPATTRPQLEPSRISLGSRAFRRP